MRKILLLCVLLVLCSSFAAAEGGTCSGGGCGVGATSAWCIDGDGPDTGKFPAGHEDVRAPDNIPNVDETRNVRSTCQDEIMANPAKGLGGRPDFFRNDYCMDGYYRLVEWECTGCPGGGSQECDNRNAAECDYGCLDGRCANRGEIPKLLLGAIGGIAVEGRCKDTDVTREHPDGVNYDVQGICIDGNGKYWVDHCNFAHISEYQCSYVPGSSSCVPAEDAKMTYDGCQEGRVTYADQTVSGCCLNPKTTACDWMENKNECCPPNPTKYASAGERGPKTEAECKNEYFYPTEESGTDICARIPHTFPKWEMCVKGCCCQLNAAGQAEASETPKVACTIWVPYGDLESVGGCTAANCAAILSNPGQPIDPNNGGISVVPVVPPEPVPPTPWFEDLLSKPWLLGLVIGLIIGVLLAISIMAGWIPLTGFLSFFAPVGAAAAGLIVGGATTFIGFGIGSIFSVV